MRTFIMLVAGAHIALAAGAQAVAAQTLPRTDPRWERCRNLGSQFEDAESVRNCTALLTILGISDQDRYDALMSRAYSMTQLQNFAAAIADLDTALPLAQGASARAEALIMRANARSLSGQSIQAVLDADDAVAADPGSVRAVYGRAVIREQQGNFSGALTDADRANQLVPHFAEARNQACWLRAAQLNTELEKAAEDCDMAVQLAPQVGTFYDSRGMVALRLGLWQEAYDNYSAAIELEPNEASGWYGRGLVLSRVRAGDSGASDLAKASALDPDIAEVYRLLGLVAGQTAGLSPPTRAEAQRTDDRQGFAYCTVSNGFVYGVKYTNGETGLAVISNVVTYDRQFRADLEKDFKSFVEQNGFIKAKDLSGGGYTKSNGCGYADNREAAQKLRDDYIAYMKSSLKFRIIEASFR